MLNILFCYWLKKLPKHHNLFCFTCRPITYTDQIATLSQLSRINCIIGILILFYLIGEHNASIQVNYLYI